MKKSKRFAKLSIVLGLCLMLACSGIAYLFNTNAGKVDVKEIYYETQFGTLSGLVYRPTTASATAPAPAIVLAHGYGGTRETQDIPAVELSRRGYVVFAVDLYGHGHSTLKVSLPDKDALKLNELNAAGLWDAVLYMGNCKYVNQSKISIAAQSISEMNTASKALDYDNALIDAGNARRISAVLFVGGEPADYSLNALRSRDVGILTGKNNEFAEHKNYLASESARSFVNELMATESRLPTGEEAVNGLKNLRTPGYTANQVFLNKTEEFATGGITAGTVLNLPDGWATEIATAVSGNVASIASYTWTRISTAGARTVIAGATSPSYALVAADIAAGVKVEVAATVTYGGALRAVYLSNSTYSGLVNSFSGAKAYINFFGMATQVRPSAYLTGAANSEIAQTWWIKAACNIAALIGFFFFVTGVVLCLMKLSFFRSLNHKAELVFHDAESGEKAEAVATGGTSVENTAGTTVTDEVVSEDETPASADKPKSRLQKILYWSAFAVNILFGGILFYALIYGVGGGAVAVNFNGAFPQPVSNAVLVWTLVMAVVMSGVFVLSMILNKVLNKNGGTNGPTVKDSFRGWGVSDKISNILKAILITAAALFSGYVIMFFCQWMWQVDFRFGSIAAKTFNKSLIGIIIRYIPFFLIFYIVQSFVINNSLAVKRREIWNYLLAIAMIAGGLLLVNIIYYFGILGGSKPFGQSMVPVLATALIPLLAVSAVLSRFFYKKTGKIWLGAFLNTLLLTVIMCANTITLLV